MPCPICGEAASWPIAHRTEPHIARWRAEIGNLEPDDWRLCRRCGNAFPSAQPELQVLQRIWEMHRAAATTNADDDAKTWRNRRRVSQVWAERSYRLLSPLAPRSGRFLDIACGLGQTVRTFADHGWDAEGIDANPNMRPLHQQLGIRSRIGQFEGLELKESYDLIHIAHAIYFMTHPMKFIAKVQDHLAPGGLFCVIISDFMSNTDADPPAYAHTFMPTGASMRYALAVAGFETVLSRKISGSVYLAARPFATPHEVKVYPRLIRLGFRTKKARYILIGKLYLGVRAIAKWCRGFFRSNL
jgi:SAM-dependent methyltransferase